MKSLTIKMNGNELTKAGIVYLANSVKHLTEMEFVASFREYGETTFELNSKEYANEVSISNNGGTGNFNVNFKIVPNKSQMVYMIKFKIIENNKPQIIIIQFSSLATGFSNCNQGYVAPSMTYSNNKQTFNPKLAFLPGDFGNGAQWNNYVSIGKAFGNCIYRPVSIVGTAKRVATTFAHKRSFSAGLNSLWIEVTFDEKTVDTYTITDHPVEDGSIISDHLVRMPVEYTIKAGFFGNGLINTIKIIGNIISNWSKGQFIGQTLLQSQYQQLVALQESKSLFKIVTPKRIYKNMVIKSLTVETDIDTENVLNFTAVCREIQMASTSIIASAIKNVSDTLEINPDNVTGTTSLTPVVNNSARLEIFNMTGM